VKLAHKTLDEVLNNEETTKQFMEFMKNDHSLENLQFILDVRKYIAASNKLNDMAKDIFLRYLETESELEVNINRQMREDIRSAVAHPDARGLLFENALNEIQFSVETDSLPRYYLSKQKASEARPRGTSNSVTPQPQDIGSEEADLPHTVTSH
jgi:hypothetical protein